MALMSASVVTASRRLGRGLCRDLLGASVLLVCLAMIPAVAQALAASQRASAFEFVSIRASSSDDSAVAGSSPTLSALPGGRFEARRQTLADLARVAFGFEDLDSGNGVVEVELPWQGIDRFDITASADRDWSTPPAGSRVPMELRGMLRALLEERFELKAHVDTRNRNVNALRLVRPDAGPGPNVRPADGDCERPDADSPTREQGRSTCGVMLTSGGIEARGATIAELALYLRRVGRMPSGDVGVYPVIVDQTNLPGRYDVSFTVPRPRDSRTKPGSTADLEYAAIVQALETQLGLKLERSRAPVTMLIIDKARRPRVD